MFTGIVQKSLNLKNINQKSAFLWELVLPDDNIFIGIKVGASVAVNGVCLTVVKQDKDEVIFDVMQETWQVTNLNQLHSGSRINIERSVAFGDEIGGHLLCGHVNTTVKLETIDKRDAHQWILTLQTSRKWMSYILPKGYVALDGMSLTIVDVDLAENKFTVHLIPETIQRTNIQYRSAGEFLNLEVEQMTKTIVETVTRLKNNV